MALAEFIDQFRVRVLLALAVGVPVTLFALAFGFLGLVTGLGGLATGTTKGLFLGITAATVLGLFGVVGAWLRLSAVHTSLPQQKRFTIVALLGCGVASAILMAGYAVSLRGTVAALASFAAAAFGITLILATPAVRANPTVKRDAPQAARPLP